MTVAGDSTHGSLIACMTVLRAITGEAEEDIAVSLQMYRNNPIRQWHAISPREGLGDERWGIQEYTEKRWGVREGTSVHYNYEEKYILTNVQ